MIDRVIDFSVRNRFLVFLLVAAAAVAGWWPLTDSPRPCLKASGVGPLQASRMVAGAT